MRATKGHWSLPRPLVATAAALGLRVEVVRTPPGTKGFVGLPRRWVVERTFGWRSRYRRVAGRDYEANPRNREALIKACFGHLMSRPARALHQAHRE